MIKHSKLMQKTSEPVVNANDITRIAGGASIKGDLSSPTDIRIDGNIDGKDFAIATGSLSKTFNGIINNNPTANYIFTLLKTEQTEDSIVQAMLEKYDAPEDVIRADVRELLDVIRKAGILEE